MTSLIQQRMALERTRTAAIAWTLFGGFCGVLGIATLLVGTEPTRVAIIVAVAGVLIAVGLVKMKRYRQAITAFSAENGPDADKR